MPRSAIRIFLAALAICWPVPLAAQAATVGFVPDTGLWFSKTEFTPGEVIRVYTVVVNNEYYAVEGTVGFYDNDKPIASVELKNMLKDSARQLKVFWEPTEGAHRLSAHFIQAFALDEKGNSRAISLTDINSQVGSPLRYVSGGIDPVVSGAGSESAIPVSSGASQTSSAPVAIAANPGAGAAAAVTVPNPVEVAVKRHGEKLLLSAPRPASGQLASGAAPADGVVASSTLAIPGGALNATLDEFFAKNRAAIAKTQAIVGSITTTAGRINETYERGKATVAQGQQYYDAGQKQWEKIRSYLDKFKPVVAKLKPWWEKISGDNNPRRIALIVGGLFALWLLFRLTRGRLGQYYDR